MLHPAHPSNQTGFTLIEMLVVVAILAAVAGVASLALGGFVGQNRADLVRAEMSVVAKSMQRFHRDTGYWPKEGPFAAESACVTDSQGNTIDDSPALLEQLRAQPFFQQSSSDPDCDFSRPILEYDVASGTGWNGPYIRELDNAYVTLGDDLEADGAGVPTAGKIIEISAIGDPFNDAPAGAYFEWVSYFDEDNDGAIERVRIGNLGKPFLYFIDDGARFVDNGAGASTGVYGCTPPCLLSLGPNGIYESDASDDQFGGDDIVINLRGNP